MSGQSEQEEPRREGPRAIGDELVTPKDIATKTQVTESTVRNWIKKGYIKAVVLPSGHRRIRKAELDRLLTEYFDFGAPVVESNDKATLVPIERVEQLERFVRHIIAHGEWPLDQDDIKRAKALVGNNTIANADTWNES